MNSHGHNQMRTMKADRIKIIWLWLIGLPARIISLYTGTSIRTVSRWIRRWKEEGHVEARCSQSHFLFSPSAFYDNLPFLFIENNPLSIQLLNAVRSSDHCIIEEIHRHLNLASYSPLHWTTSGRQRSPVATASGDRRRKCVGHIYRHQHAEGI